MWEIPRCKKWPGSREFHPLQQIMTPRFCFFVVGWFWGFRIYGDFGWFCFLGWFLFSIRNVRIWMGDFLVFGWFCFGQECQNGFCMRRQWCPAENANWASTEAKKMWKLLCLWKLKMAKQQNQKLVSNTFHIANLWRRTTWISRRWNCGSNLMCITTSHCLRISPPLALENFMSICKTLRFGLDVSTADEKESIPYPQRPWVFEGRSLSRKVSGHQRFDTITIVPLFCEVRRWVSFFKVDGSLALKERYHELVWRWRRGSDRWISEDSMVSFGCLEGWLWRHFAWNPAWSLVWIQATRHLVLQMIPGHTPTTCIFEVQKKSSFSVSSLSQAVSCRRMHHSAGVRTHIDYKILSEWPTMRQRRSPPLP